MSYTLELFVICMSIHLSLLGQKLYMHVSFSLLKNIRIGYSDFFFQILFIYLINYLASDNSYYKTFPRRPGFLYLVTLTLEFYLLPKTIYILGLSFLNKKK